MTDSKVNTLQNFAQNHQACINYIMSYSVHNNKKNNNNEILKENISKDDIINKVKSLMSEMLKLDYYKEIRKSLLEALSILTTFNNIKENYANKLLYNSTIYMIAILLEQELTSDVFINLFQQNIDLLIYVNYLDLYDVMINFIENVNLPYFKCLKLFFKLYSNEDNYEEIIKNEKVDSGKIKNYCVKIKEIRLKKEKDLEEKNIEKIKDNPNKEEENKNNKLTIENLQEEINKLKNQHNTEINNLTEEIKTLKEKNIYLETELKTLKTLFLKFQSEK